MAHLRIGVVFLVVMMSASVASAQPALWSDDDDLAIRGYVVPDPAPPVEFHQTLTPGSVIPDDVPLKLFPANAAAKYRGYAYFVSADRKLVVVEADTKRVVRILGTN